MTKNIIKQPLKTYEVSRYDFIPERYFGDMLYLRLDKQLGEKQELGNSQYVISRGETDNSQAVDEESKSIIIALNDTKLDGYKFAVSNNGEIDLIETTLSGKQLNREELPSAESDRIAHSIAHKTGIQTDTLCCQLFTTQQ